MSGPRENGARAITHLLTWHGTVLCRRRADNVVVHRPIVGPFDGLELLSLGELDKMVQVNLLNLLRNDIDQLTLSLSEGPMAGWAFTRSPDHRSLLLSHTGRVLAARAPGEDMDLVTDAIDSTSCFLPITTADFNALRDIVTSQWLIQSDEPPQPAPGELGAGFVLRVGSLPIDLRWNVPFDLSEFPHRLTVLREGWRIDRAFRFRPLVFYTAFGAAEASEELALSLRSLIGPGDYAGDVAVLTDRGPDEIRALRPRGMRGSMVVIQCDAVDDAAQAAARLAVLGWRDAWTFQPLLYVDTSVIFDGPITPSMQALAMMDRMAAPLAPAGADTAVPAFGAELVRDDAWDPAEVLGVSTAVMGIPNLGRHAHMLDLIGRIMRNRASIFGRQALPDMQQAVANYVSFRLSSFDTDLLTPCLSTADAVAGGADPAGMVHFGSVPRGPNRIESMQAYLTRIDGTRPGDVVPLDDVAAYSMNPVLDFETVMQSLQR
jgi:hypothetical protein